MTPQSPQRVAASVAVVVMVGLAGAVDARLSAEDEAISHGLVQRILAQTTRADVAIRAIRELRAGTRSGKHRGWMEVETVLNPAQGFTWKVIDEGGSERTRNKIFRELLETEAATWRDGTADTAALTIANYEFHPLPESGDGQIRLRLKPRRADAKLVDGTLTVSPDGYPLRLEGTLAKSPSFWVKSVAIVKRYGRLAGVALPTAIESLADVRMFGQSTLTMRYRYSEVNGRTIPDTLASAPSFGPSAEILAIYAASAQR
jgi:hypothetical protein